MAVLIANADGNLTGASTFAAVEAGSGSLALFNNNTTALNPAATANGNTFTITNGNVIDGVILFVKVNSTGATGTFKVALQKSGVDQASVTVNKSDLPPSTSPGSTVPVFFKFTGTATGDGASTWRLSITTTGLIQIIISTTATTSDWTRAFRRTTAATAAAGDDLYICGELTGAGTKNVRAVVMDSVTTTTYGSGVVTTSSVMGSGITVFNWATLASPTATATNYYLKIAGNLIIYDNGEVNLGNRSTSSIPRDSTAILGIVPTAADCDMGVIVAGGVLRTAGLSRTSGKDVIACKLTADTSPNLCTAGSLATSTNATPVASAQLDPTGTSMSLGTVGVSDTVTNATHGQSSSALGSVTNTTQVYSIWFARGSGTNNRFMRMALGSTGAGTSPPTNGFYADIDLQAGTIGTCTANGNGTATSSHIVAYGTGFLCTIVGKASSGALSPIASFNICSAAGTTSFAGAANQSVIYCGPAVYTLSARPTDLSVDTDTGWLAGDVLAVASTSRTATDTELVKLASDAGPSTLTLTQYTHTRGASFHSGTTGIQAEVINLTRNVIIRSESTTLTTYLYAWYNGTVECYWTEICRIGTNASTKFGIVWDITNSVASPKVFNYCSVHDSEAYCFVAGGGVQSNSGNATISNTTMWNFVNFGINTGSIVMALSDYVFTGNYIFNNNAGGGIGSTGSAYNISNNTVVGTNTSAGGIGMSAGAVGEVVGTFSGNTVHSTSNIGFVISGQFSGTMSNTKSWRNGGVGMTTGGGFLTCDQFFDGLTLTGNTTTNLVLTATDAMATNLRIKDFRSSGDTTFATTNSMLVGNAALVEGYIDNYDSSTTGIYVAPSVDIAWAATTSFNFLKMVFRNPLFGAATLFPSKAHWSRDSYIAYQKYNQTAGDHRLEMKYGTSRTDTTITNIASPSQRLTPNNAANKFESAPKGKGAFATVDNGGTKTVSVAVRKSVIGDGAAYNGNQPRLIQRANPALGQNYDVVIDTMTAAAGSWETLTGSSSTATDNGVFEFIVDCDGTAGWIDLEWVAT